MRDTRQDKDIRKEYDFNRGERGKYARRYREGSNVVVLDPDVAKTFKTPDAVNTPYELSLRRTRERNKTEGPPTGKEPSEQHFHRRVHHTCSSS